MGPCLPMSKPHSADLLGMFWRPIEMISSNIDLSRVLRSYYYSPQHCASLIIVTSQIAPLMYDTLVTVMTVVKAVSIRRRSGGSSSRLIQTFLREGMHVFDALYTSWANGTLGVFYYILISIANLINGIFYLQ